MFKKSDILFLAAAFLSFLLSISLWFGVVATPNTDAAIFVGIWVPSILALGIYFKTKIGGM